MSYSDGNNGDQSGQQPNDGMGVLMLLMLAGRGTGRTTGRPLPPVVQASAVVSPPLMPSPAARPGFPGARREMFHPSLEASVFDAWGRVANELKERFEKQDNHSPYIEGASLPSVRTNAPSEGEIQSAPNLHWETGENFESGETVSGLTPYEGRGIRDALQGVNNLLLRLPGLQGATPHVHISAPTDIPAGAGRTARGSRVRKPPLERDLTSDTGFMSVVRSPLWSGF